MMVYQKISMDPLMSFFVQMFSNTFRRPRNYYASYTVCCHQLARYLWVSPTSVIGTRESRPWLAYLITTPKEFLITLTSDFSHDVAFKNLHSTLAILQRSLRTQVFHLNWYWLSNPVHSRYQSCLFVKLKNCWYAFAPRFSHISLSWGWSLTRLHLFAALPRHEISELAQRDSGVNIVVGHWRLGLPRLMLLWFWCRIVAIYATILHQNHNEQSVKRPARGGRRYCYRAWRCRTERRSQNSWSTRRRRWTQKNSNSSQPKNHQHPLVSSWCTSTSFRRATPKTNHLYL